MGTKINSKVTGKWYDLMSTSIPSHILFGHFLDSNIFDFKRKNIGFIRHNISIIQYLKYHLLYQPALGIDNILGGSNVQRFTKNRKFCLSVQESGGEIWWYILQYTLIWSP